MPIEIFYLVIFALFLLFLLLGMHIHTVLLSIGVLGIIILEGLPTSQRSCKSNRIESLQVIR
ncbi:hypothetical protein [Geomicrobium sp. JCM 19055]|uniref:hypothetical protein n=1 Tax=Geomicrobium sp. JCM 19055 TaxID=1460649 RepID=UPI00045ED8AF|nr:hypothetical protein [Geomicrobium sp. JCM 19055]GAK00749.1 hypothetical protein JCM19055_3863 [Geomicrobium sp. JCM 19055]